MCRNKNFGGGPENKKRMIKITVIVPEKVRNVATIPAITLAITAIIVQSHFVLQQQIFILSPPLTLYASGY